MFFRSSRALACVCFVSVLAVGVAACGGSDSSSGPKTASDQASGLTVTVAGDQVTLKRTAKSTAGTGGTSGLAALTRRVPGAGHQPWGHAHDALTAGEQEPLKRSGDVPAVLDRPHPLRIVEAASPDQQTLERALLGWQRSVDEHAPGRLVDRRDRV